jgi:hypothetical protein
MMKKIIYLSICLLFIACASAKKHYSDGNYKKAYTSALKELKDGKKDRSLKSILNNSLGHMITDNNDETQSLLRSDLIEDWEEAFDMTDDLLDLYDDGRRYTDSKYETMILSMREDNNILKDDIITSYVDMGDMNMSRYSEKGDKRAAQEAYYMYREALKYDHPMGMDDIRSSLDEALISGSILVDVTIDSWDVKYGWDISRKFEDLEDNDQLFYEVTFDNWGQDTDCRIEIDFARLDMNTRDQSRTENYTEQIEDGYRTEIDTSGNATRIPIYKDVTADVIITEEIRSYNWDIRVRVDNGIGYCNFRNNQFRVSREVVVTNYQTRGDSRAIPDVYRNTSNQSFNSSDERNLIQALIEEAFDDIERYYF